MTLGAGLVPGRIPIIKAAGRDEPGPYKSDHRFVSGRRVDCGDAVGR